MAKKLIPREVRKIVFKEWSNNAKIGKHICNTTELDLIVSVLDMNRKIVIKTNYLCDELVEGKEYEIEIDQCFTNWDTAKLEIQKRIRNSMRLAKIEIPTSGSDDCPPVVTYVFEAGNTAKLSIDESVNLNTIKNLEKAKEYFAFVGDKAKFYDGCKLNDGVSFK